MIRSRRADDLVDLVAVATRVHDVDGYPIHVPDGDLATFLTRPTPTTAWVAVHGSAIVGHVALHETTAPAVMDLVEAIGSDRPPVYVARLLVDPGARRLGIGRRLLDHACRAAVAAERTPFLDVVDTPRAAPAIALYRHDGWDEVGRVTFDLAGTAITEIVFRHPAP